MEIQALHIHLGEVQEKIRIWCSLNLYSVVLELADALQPNKPYRGKCVQSHLTLNDPNMSTDYLVAIFRSLHLNHISFPFLVSPLPQTLSGKFCFPNDSCLDHKSLSH